MSDFETSSHDFTHIPSSTMSITSEDSDIESNAENKEETSQQWILRHLLQFTGCNEASAKNLVEGDCGALISLLTDITQEKVLFITVRKPTATDQQLVMEPTVPTIIPDTEKDTDSKKPVEKKTKKSKGKKKEKKKKKNNEKKTDKKEEIPVSKEPFILTIENPLDTIFDWFTSMEIPSCESFVFIVPKTKSDYHEVSLDELYHVGFFKHQKILKTAMKSLEGIFQNENSFEKRISLMLMVYGINDFKIPSDNLLERFIISEIARNYNFDGKVKNSDTDARSITLILSQTIQSYCNQHDDFVRPKLLLQLSFFDIEFLNGFSDISASADRLVRALDNISILQFLYKDNANKWNRKTFLYLLDLFSTILANYISRKSKILKPGSETEEKSQICKEFETVVGKFVKVSREIFELHEDWAATDKMASSFHIVTILEEEIDSIVNKIKEMNSETRDMLMDRSAIQASQTILEELDTYLTEKCLESAVESGNLDSLRNLATTIVKYNRRMERVITLL